MKKRTEISLIHPSCLTILKTYNLGKWIEAKSFHCLFNVLTHTRIEDVFLYRKLKEI